MLSLDKNAVISLENATQNIINCRLEISEKITLNFWKFST